jgi:hypothetical protein
VDESRFRELMVESDDIQADAMRGARSDLNAYVEAAQEARFVSRRDVRVGGAVLGAGALGLAALALAAPALAASSTDVMALQTAASLENLAIFTYKTALGLPFIGGSTANGVVKAFATKTMAQHTDHAAAFNAAISKLGGTTQTATDPKYTPIVQMAAGKIKNARWTSSTWRSPSRTSPPRPT